MKTLHRGPLAPLPVIGYRKGGAPIYAIAGGDGTAPGNPVLNRLLDERQSQVDLMDGILQQVQTEGRDMVESERNNLKAIKERIGQLDEQIKPLQEFEELRGASVQATRNHRPTAPASQERQPGNLAYTAPRGHEYRTAGQLLADAWTAQNKGDEAARSRLEGAGLILDSGLLQRAALPHTTTTEVPGLLPTNIVGDIMNDIDAARPFMSSIGVKDLGSIPGTSFNRPVVTGHVSVGKQAKEKDEVEKGQFKVGSVPFTKDTYGGWTNVSRQSIDWTSPGVWDALLTDFIEIYGIETEEAAVAAFSTAITQKTDTVVDAPLAPTLNDYLRGLYDAAAKAYAGVKRLPDTIWCSLDMWATMGPLIDQLKAATAGNGGGSSAIDSFTGNLLNVPRIVVPSLPAGSLIVGVKSRTEAYEDRIGFLSAVQPKVLGVELAYGGYMASGTLKPEGFARVTFKAAA